MIDQTDIHDRSEGRTFVKVLKSALTALSIVRLTPLIALMLLSSNRNTIYADLERWAHVYHFERPQNLTDRVLMFAHLMTWLPEYRNVFYLRTGLPGRLLSIFCRPLSSLHLGNTSIGRGLFIMHGEGTFVSATKIGENCWINQQVTIGHTNETDIPSIGNNVTILAGAKILGRVSIGDNATIGANTVVIKDVPSNATVMSVPAKVIWIKKPLPRDGELDRGEECASLALRSATLARELNADLTG
jgi:serine O-acetyltransferase